MTMVNRYSRWNSFSVFLVAAMVWFVIPIPKALGNHQGHTHRLSEESSVTMGEGHAIPGAPFKVFLGKGKGEAKEMRLSQARADEAIHTVVDALTLMTHNRTQYHRFDEALTKDVLQQVIIEPKVLNREGKEFPFLVARTKHKGKVRLLISASALKEKGYLKQPDKLVPVLAREFQWVLSKADTSPKRRSVLVKRDLKNTSIKSNKEIKGMTGEERAQALLALFETYLTTVDDYASLKGQPSYEVGTTTLIQPTHPDSTTKLYDIRIREALQKIVGEPYFEKHTPKAIRALLNGKIWNVSFAKIDKRDWATRTRVLPKDKSVTVGENGRTVQPAKILVNVIGPRHRKIRFIPRRTNYPWVRSRLINWLVSLPGRFKRTSPINR